MKNRSGFTLLELLMVVIIIAILASIALPQYIRVSERSRASEALTMLAAIRSSELRFQALDPNEAFTATMSNLDIHEPGQPPDQPSTLWTYSLVVGKLNQGVATRNGTGSSGGKKIVINLDTGATCADDNVWGVTLDATLSC